MLVGYWGSNLVLSIIYYFNLFPQWKIQAPNKWPERKLWVAAILNELVGTCLLQPVFGYFVLGRVLPYVLYCIVLCGGRWIGGSGGGGAAGVY